MTDEEWRPAVGFEGRYEVSDLGRVRSLLPTSGTNGGRRRGAPDGVLKPTPSGKYYTVSLGRRNTRTVHTLVLEAFVGPCPEGLEACHNNGDHADNTLGNLRWDTRSENAKDKTRHGTNPNALKTSCPAEHEYDDENTGIRPDGSRYCKKCARGWSHDRYHRNKKGDT